MLTPSHGIFRVQKCAKNHLNSGVIENRIDLNCENFLTKMFSYFCKHILQINIQNSKNNNKMIKIYEQLTYIKLKLTRKSFK